MYRLLFGKKVKLFLASILIIGCVLQAILSIFGTIDSRETARIQSEEPTFHDLDTTLNYMNVCALPVYDYWHPKIMKYVDYDFDPTKNCDRNFKPFTELMNGKWRIVEEGKNCSARCFYTIDDMHVNHSEWMQPGPVDCEFLEAVCWEAEKEVYGYIHTQIIPKKPTVPPPKTTPPNVFVFLFDSMSVGQAKRQFTKTLSTLNNRLEAIEFPFINKVGENSRPNGLALWFGKLIKMVRGELFGGAHIPVDWDKKQFCQTYLNGSIFDDFNDQGYMTFMIDDWKDQMVNWPDCKGFKDAPMHHTMHPFFFIYENKGTSKTRKHLKGDLCREIYHAAFEYFQDFMDNYKDQPKFTWSWLSTVGHDHVNGFMRVDKHMNEILEKNIETFDNSFVLFMGDHGLRLSGSGFLRTDIGIFEKNNPYFSISIPKNLRKTPELLDVMRENSKKLQTLFDIRSTLLDIARYQPKSDFTNRSVDEVAGERGHSLLRRQPDTLRTCGRLPIPPEYCICQVGKVSIDDVDLKERFGHGFIDHINKLLDDKKLSSVCERFQLQEVTSLLHHGFLNQTKPKHSYDIVVSTGSPSYAQFQTLITYDQKNNKTSFGSVMRLDTYGETGICGREFESMCFCKNLSFFTKWNYQRKRVYPSLINYLLNFFFD